MQVVVVVVVVVFLLTGNISSISRHIDFAADLVSAQFRLDRIFLNASIRPLPQLPAARSSTKTISPFFRSAAVSLTHLIPKLQLVMVMGVGYRGGQRPISSPLPTPTTPIPIFDRRKHQIEAKSSCYGSPQLRVVIAFSPNNTLTYSHPI